MNNYESNNRNNRSFQSNRSDRYRNTEERNEMRFDDYGSPARGGYGDEGRMGTFGNQGNEMGGSRNLGNNSTYSSSRNYGNMGSYGGAQGYGSSRGGYASQRQQDSDREHAFDSGMGPMGGMSQNLTTGHDSPRSYGYENDYDSHGGNSAVRDVNYKRNNDLYGSDVSRRFQGSDQDYYDFDRNASKRTGNFGGSEGNYRNSGYDLGNYNQESRDQRGGSNSYSSDRYNSSGNRNQEYRGGHGPNSDYGNRRARNMRDYDRY